MLYLVKLQAEKIPLSEICTEVNPHDMFLTTEVFTECWVMAFAA